MKTFATLIHTLESTNKVLPKLEAIGTFLQEASDADKLWLLALFTGRKPKRSVSTSSMKQWALEWTQLPEWLLVESYASVGDLGETLALILPPPTQKIEKSLAEWMQDIIQIGKKSEEEKKQFVLEAWQGLDITERFIFNKLLGGSFRIGVASKTFINALAKHFHIDANEITHSIMGDWNIHEVNFEELIQGKYINVQNSKPYPFCLAYPLETEVEQLGPLTDWQIEYKWDGIRGQIIKRNEEIFIWSRGEELVTEQFPELVEAVKNIPCDFVIDGEILAYKNKEILNFTELQKRLNRKTLSKKMLEETPVVFFIYDLLEIQQQDIRALSMSERRHRLEQLLHPYLGQQLHLSAVISASTWEEISEIRSQARDINSEGLMLKKKDSIYHTGRKKGDWWKWKIDPLTMDAVLIYAQKGSGRRSGHYTDYTFAVRDGDQLVTIAKAYSGLTDKEIQEVSRFVNKNAVEKFGPVRTVKPELVFEIAFEGIGYSSRHKSGVAVRFPRIARWRKDKTVDEIDDLETIKKLIQ